MRHQTLLLLFLTGCLFSTSLRLSAQSNIKYGPDYIVFEAEDTSSPLDKWKLRTPDDPLYYLGTDLEAIHQTYIDFRGPWASKESPLSYTFTCPKTATYRLVMRMYQPLQDGEAGDKRNDVFIKLEGNYTSQTNTTKVELEKEHKFWGRGVRKWGSCHKLEIGGTHMNALYGLIEGEEYTLTMSGRSPWTSIDYILFFDVDLNFEVVNHTDIAVALPADYHPNSATSTSIAAPRVSTFDMYPNPAQDQLTIALPRQERNATVSIYSLSGKAVYTRTLQLVAEDIDISEFSAGLYMVQLITEDGVSTKKLIID